MTRALLSTLCVACAASLHAADWKVIEPSAEVRAALKLSPFYKKDAHLRDYDPAKVSAFAWRVEKPFAPVPAQ